MYTRAKYRADSGTGQVIQGFSLLELLIVVAITVLIAGLSLPSLMGAYHRSKLRSAGTDFSALAQMARMRSVQDDRYYSVWPYTGGALSQQYVDIYPQGTNGASGYGNGQQPDPKDPVITISTEIVQQAAGSAPSTANLSTQLLGANPNGLAPKDGTDPNFRVTFGPEGLPCKPFSPPSGGGTVCNSQGGPIAYWVFFQSSVTQDWEAVTVTPAGRIQKWYYDGAAWQKL